MLQTKNDIRRHALKRSESIALFLWRRGKKMLKLHQTPLKHPSHFSYGDFFFGRLLLSTISTPRARVAQILFRPRDSLAVPLLNCLPIPEILSISKSVALKMNFNVLFVAKLFILILAQSFRIIHENSFYGQ